MYISSILFVHCVIVNSVSASCSPSELAIWKDSQNFSDNLAAFARASVGRSAGVIFRLLEEYPDFDPSCAACFGALVGCGTRFCWHVCFFNHTSAQCVSCSNNNCRLAFLECTGYSEPEDWPLPPSNGREQLEEDWDEDN